MSRPFTFFVRIFLTLALVAIVGIAAYQSGYARGMVEGQAFAAQLQSWQNNDGATAAPYGFPGFYGPGWYGGLRPGFMGSSGINLLGCLAGLLIFGSLFFILPAMFFFRGRKHGWECPEDWRGRMPPWAHHHPHPGQPNSQEPSQPEPQPDEDK